MNSSFRKVVFIKSIPIGGHEYNSLTVDINGVEWLWSVDGGMRAKVRDRILFIPWSNVTFAEEE